MWILIIIFILFLIWHYSHVFLIGILDVDALVWQEKLFFQLFCLESKFICQIRQTWIVVIISILFMVGHYNHVFLIRIHDLMLWFGKKNFLSTILLTNKVCQSNEASMDFHNNHYSFYDWEL